MVILARCRGLVGDSGHMRLLRWGPPLGYASAVDAARH
jgi:hypothetical protein